MAVGARLISRRCGTHVDIGVGDHRERLRVDVPFRIIGRSILIRSYYILDGRALRVDDRACESHRGRRIELHRRKLKHLRLRDDASGEGGHNQFSGAHLFDLRRPELYCAVIAEHCSLVGVRIVPVKLRFEDIVVHTDLHTRLIAAVGDQFPLGVLLRDSVLSLKLGADQLHAAYAHIAARVLGGDRGHFVRLKTYVEI